MMAIATPVDGPDLASSALVFSEFNIIIEYLV